MDINELKKKANQGKKEAQNNLGMCYANGEGVEQNYELAVYWFKKSAEQGAATPKYNLGVCYYGGKGVEQSYKKAVDLFEKAANQGNVDAQYMLGVCYYSGKGVEQSYKKAVDLFEKAANQGNEYAQYDLGNCYCNGEGVEQSYKKAVDLFEKAADQGNADAQSSLGECYLHGIGIEQNFKEAERLFIESVKNGNEKNKYNTKIFKQLQGKKIEKIKNISEEFDEDNVGAVLISPQENISSDTTHTLYDIETYKKIKKVVNEILEDVEEVNQNKDNELDVFMKIYIRIGKMISYDYQAMDKIIGEIVIESRNLIGGLLKGKCVCAGYAEILRNVLSCRGIECIFVGAYEHAFNQVKINGKWYYCDLTNSIDSLYSGKNITDCLLSKEEFENEFDHIIMNNQIIYPSPESYSQEEVKEAVKKIINSDEKFIKVMNDFEDGRD